MDDGGEKNEDAVPEDCVKGEHTMKKGDTVRVFGNAVGTAWEIGMIMDINKDGAIIGYCARYIDDPWALYGCQPVQRVPLNKLELIWSL